LDLRAPYLEVVSKALGNERADQASAAEPEHALATVGDVLLTPTRIYAPDMLALREGLAAAGRPLLGLAHVTGGGLAGNLVRVLPPDVEAVIDAGSWPWPPLFRVLMRAGKVGREEMRRVFNLGVGMIACVARDDVEAAARAAERAQVQAWIIGEIRPARQGASAAAVRFEER
ncbi:MAG TPA: AIR synthase-related protein, partial [Gemmatimonadales bacterium]|nr:AIR synthase-related protein [Gemmatimonadales bacterium]